MGTFRGESKKKYRVRESGEYKNIKYFCSYGEIINYQIASVTCFINPIHPRYSEERVNKTKEITLRITSDAIPTTLGDYQYVIDGFTFNCPYPLKTHDINEFHNNIINKVEEILSEIIGSDDVIEAYY